MLYLGIEAAFFEIAKELKDSNPEPVVDEVSVRSILYSLEHSSFEVLIGQTGSEKEYESARRRELF